MNDRVVLLHGIARGGGSVRKLERAIAADDYETLSFSYPSRSLPLAALAEHLHTIRGWIEGHPGQTHFVTYSMGGLVARSYIARFRPANLGRVVMLAPPSQGSEVADLLANIAPYHAFFGPAGAELTTWRAEAQSRALGAVDFALGIIAGNRFIDPVGWLLIKGPNDGRVSVERTKLAGMTDHITLPATHFRIMNNRKAIRQTLYFLRHGRFANAA